MTTRSYTEGNEVPAQPAIRSAWDAVKGQVIALTACSVAVGINAVSATVNISHGSTANATIGVVAGLAAAGGAALNIGVMAIKLKRLPAPPQP